MTVSPTEAALSRTNPDKNVRATLRRALRPTWPDLVISAVPMLGIAASTAGLAWLGGPLLVALAGATVMPGSGSGLPTPGVPNLDAPGSMEHIVADGNPIVVLVLGLCGFAALRGLAQYGQAAATERLQQNAMARLRHDLVARLLAVRPSALVGISQTEIAARIASDVTRIDALVGNGAMALLTHGLTLAALGGFALHLDVTISVLALLSLPPVALLGWRLSRTARVSVEEALRAHAALAAKVGETAEGVAAIQSYGRQSWAAARLSRAGELVRGKMLDAARARAVLGPAMGFAASAAFALTLVVARERLSTGVLTTEKAGQLFAALIFMVKPMTALGTIAGTFAGGLAALDRLGDLMMRLPPVPADTDTTAASGVPREALRFESITVDNATFSYGATEVLKGVSLTVRRGEVVAIVGENGAGKTTLLELILGHAEPATGSIAVNGRNYADWGRAALGRFYAWVPEEPVLFADTVAGNVTLSDGAVDETRLDQALADAGALGFVRALPEGVHTMLASSGHDLSLGQRQRLCIARALYHDAPVLVLDEPTAHLDGEAESELAATIDRLLVNRTVILVAHRHRTVARAHRVVVLEDGRVTAEGPPSALTQSSPAYRQLFSVGK